jgi:hypothetical protein
MPVFQASPTRYPDQAAGRVGTACHHSLRLFRFGGTLIRDQLVKLKGDHAPDGVCGHLYVNAFFLERIVERRTDPASLCHADVFFCVATPRP